MSWIFAADMHLMPGSDPGQEALLENFLSESCRSANHLFLLGDVFHCWFEQKGSRHVGNYNNYLNIFRKAVSGGLKISMVPGNRDFTAGRNLFDLTGIEVFDEEQVVSCDDKKILLTHGDMFCTADHKYQFMRRLYMNKTIRFIWDNIPWAAAEPVALHFQGKKKCFAHRMPPEKLDIQEDAVRAAFKRAGIDCILCGHVHYGSEKKIKVDAEELALYVLAPWCSAGEYMTFNGSEFKREQL
ncbi:MAG: UDP-2,3-diacylglucosamine diphosphatase [Planctomycetota bacterium]|jgi:UDP-2,3-diacylglucosamine hydrolase